MSATDIQESSPSPAEREPASLFKYSVWLHVGAGADDCTEVDERTGENRCGDSGHFHAWCRLPNQFQHHDIQEEALAAKARKIRHLRDPASSARMIVDDDLERLRDEVADEQIVDELMSVDWAQQYLEAVREVEDIDDPDADPPEDDDDPPAKLYANVERDRVRLVELLGKDERSDAEQTELDELNEHLQRHADAIEQALDRIRAPKREALLAHDTDELVDLLRKKRIRTIGDNEFQRTYSVREWLACTYTKPNGEQVFNSLATLEVAPNDVIAALEVTFDDLERTAQTVGN